MPEFVCKNCTHFRQHYVLDDQSCIRTQCGHCCRPRFKHRQPDTKACPHFEERTQPAPLPDRCGTIHYLTTRMLEHILSLELPPEIREE